MTRCNLFDMNLNEPTYNKKGVVSIYDSGNSGTFTKEKGTWKFRSNWSIFSNEVRHMLFINALNSMLTKTVIIEQ